MQNKDLRRLQLIEMDMLKKLIGYLDANKIKYYALAGTMLGAVRHQGFIPWDDDIDIGIPREDYERLLDLAEACREIDGMKFCHYRFDKKTLHYNLRAVNNDIVMTCVKGGVERETNAWITLFPLDGMPSNAIHRFIHSRILLWRRFAFVMARYQKLVDYNRPSYSKIKRRFVKLAGDLRLFNLFDEQKTFENMDKSLMKYPFMRSAYVICLMGGYKLKELFPFSVFADGGKYRFEDLTIVGPKAFDRYLTQLYGDYMTPPPVDSPVRNQHGLVKIELKCDTSAAAC